MPWLDYEECKKTLGTLRTILDDVEINCLCGAKLLSKNLQCTESKAYETAKSEYWIYCECQLCHFDYNYEKILNQYWNKSVKQDLHDKFREEMR